ncbi:MAG: flagellar biosynthesis protein FliQ [Spirochaetes bacterium]|jgi:flagellar biosynthetic protein FliQ|nr:flagellar biosynthesis protein FliQ [Spirochaetota bacterium]
MDASYAVYIIRSGVLQVLLMAAPILGIGMGVGLVGGIFQATTSIQDQTLSFIPKIAAILFAVVLFGPWMIQTLLRFTESLFEQIPNMVG